MYVQNSLFLATVAVSDGPFCGGSFAVDLLYSRKTQDGLLIKDRNGSGIKIKLNSSQRKTKEHVILHSYQKLFGDECVGVRILDEPLSQRLIKYIRYYYGERKTNCASFAEYLRTGDFVECCDENNYFAFSGGMNQYTGQSVKPGDTLCVLYYNKRARSRKVSKLLRSHYKKVCKIVVNGSLSKLKGAEGSISSEQILGMYKSGYIEDYHFMFCIGTENGQPIFIQQLGWQDPSIDTDPKSSPIIVSVGMRNISPKDTPSHVFIKKGRN
ncbi:MAG: hypothetical protein Q7K40_05685 [bacterium]|nr:hypothetical protein [bacterium]